MKTDNCSMEDCIGINCVIRRDASNPSLKADFHDVYKGGEKINKERHF